MKSYLQLIRLPALLTSLTNIWTGYFLSFPVAGWIWLYPLFVLMGISALAYASGMILNDYYDREEDQEKQKKKPLVNGGILPSHAVSLGYVLQLGALLLAISLSRNTLWITLSLLFFVNAYDIGLKHFKLLGGATMASCRFLNVALGMSLFLDQVPPERWIFPMLLFAYVFFLTRMSQMEELLERKSRFVGIAIGLAGIPILTCVLTPNFWMGLPFMFLLLYKLTKALQAAWKNYTPPMLILVVKSAVLGIVLMDAIVLA
ncbi:MAG: UbiA family prenyltransferase, partial [Planctomycetota bacterium]